MHPSNETLPARRKLLSSMVSAAALFGLNATGAAASPTASVIPAPPESDAAGSEDIFAFARLRNYKTRRSSGWDQTGGNDDSVVVEAGQTVALLETTGAGSVTHLLVHRQLARSNAPEEPGPSRLVGRRSHTLSRGPHRRLLRPGPGRVFHLSIGSARGSAHQGAETPIFRCRFQILPASR